MGIGDVAGALPAGSAVAEFRIEKVIAQPGHFGITYLAVDAEARQVALKEYFPVELAVRDGEALKLRRAEDAGIFRWGLRGFLDEAENLVRFAHASIVRGHRAFEQNGTAYFAMDFIEGETLAALLQREGRMGEARLRSFLMPVVDGMRHAHDAGLLHRDICPSDIRIANDGRPVLTDFAGARNVLRFKSRSTAHAFTPGYAPPEEYQVTGKQGPWTDIYSLAAVAYRAVTGQVPADAPARQKGAPMTPAAQLAVGRYPEDFLYAIDWGLRLDPVQRPQKIADWQAALDGEAAVPVFDEPAAAVLAVAAEPEHAVTAAPKPAPTAAASPAPRSEAVVAAPPVVAPARKLPVWAMAAVGGLVIAGLAWYSLNGRKPAPAAQSASTSVTPVPAATSDGTATAEPASTDPTATPAAAAPEQLSGLDRIASQLMQQDQDSRQHDAEAEARKALDDAERVKREQAAREQAAKEQAAVQKKLEEEQNAQKRRELEEQQAKLKAEEDARQKAEAERKAQAAAPPPAAPASAGTVAQKSVAQCAIHVSQLTDSGTLTYEDTKRVRGAVLDPGTGIVRLPPVPVPGGRPVVFEVLPDGCARVARR